MDSEYVLAIATIVLAVATVVLAIGTVAYAIFTWRMAREMELSRRPDLVLTSDLYGGALPVARLANVGAGTALDIRGQLKIEAHGEVVWQYSLELPIISPGEHRIFDAAGDTGPRDINSAIADERSYAAVLAYRDASGRKYTLARSVGWRSWKEHVFGAGMFFPDKPYEPLTDKLSDTNRILERIVSAIERRR